MYKNYIQLNIQTLDKNSFAFYIEFLKKVLKTLNLKYSLSYLPKKKKRLTVLKSPHVNKTAREQFEIKYFNCCIQLENINSIVIKWILCNKPSTLHIILKKKQKGI